MTPSWWVEPSAPPRIGFTAFAAKQLNVEIRIDDVTAAEATLIQRRIDVLATLEGLRQAKQTAAIRRAVVLSKN